MLLPKNKPIRDKKLFMSYFVEFCEYCGALATDRHHIVFKSQGGGDEHSNLICLCRECHSRAHGVDAHKWRDVFKRVKNETNR